jgi:hypothetical protein
MKWLCRIGLHRWKRVGRGETAMIRCERCGKEREPQRWYGGFGGGPP